MVEKVRSMRTLEELFSTPIEGATIVVGDDPEAGTKNNIHHLQRSRRC